MIKLSSICFGFDGRLVFDRLNLSLSATKYGLVGPNGIGKSTLAKLICGILDPTDGVIETKGRIHYLEQYAWTSEGISVSDFLGTNPFRKTAYSSLTNNLIQPLDLERSISNLSGGEWMRIRLARILAEEPKFLILDEPSNNLDFEGSEVLSKFIQNFEGGLLLISHDRHLLRQMDSILELSNLGISVYGGNFDFYAEQRDAERERLSGRLNEAKRMERKQRLEDAKLLSKQQKRIREGAKRAERVGMSNIEKSEKKRNAQVSLGNVKKLQKSREESGLQSIENALLSLKTDPFIRLDFEGAKVPSGKSIFRAESFNLIFSGTDKPLWREPLILSLSGPQRWAVVGKNGAGKSTLLRWIAGAHSSNPTQELGKLTVGARSVAYLDQNYQSLDKNATVLSATGAESRFSEVALRNELAFYGFTGQQVYQLVKTLSGGEMLKASLAQAFLGKSIPELLVLDEPTNNLDLNSIELLENALSQFKGAIIVASHDQSFLQNLNIDHEVMLPEKT